MIDLSIKKILDIDLEKQEAEAKSFTDLNSYFGGTGLGLRLLEMYSDKNPIIISVGPLNGFFPFTSKASIVLIDEGAVEDIYLGGSLSTRIKFAGLDSIVIHGVAKEKTVIEIQNSVAFLREESTDVWSLGLPGKRTIMEFDGKKVISDQYFTTPENYLEKKFIEKNIKGISIIGTEIYSPKNFEDYENLYEEILSRKNELGVEPGGYPSCSGCPMGCGKSKIGEIGGNILLNSLVACQYADKIYTDIGTIFSCLNSLGYGYTHEDIENLPALVEQTIRKI